jgi:hypothetical protein
MGVQEEMISSLIPQHPHQESHPKTEEFSKKPLVIVFEWGRNEN